MDQISSGANQLIKIPAHLPCLKRTGSSKSSSTCQETRRFPLNCADMSGTPILMWVTFAIVAAAAILADLIIHRRARKISVKAALIETAGWIAIAMIFNIWIYFERGPQPAIEFLTGYIVE